MGSTSNWCSLSSNLKPAVRAGAHPPGGGWPFLWRGHCAVQCRGAWPGAVPQCLLRTRPADERCSEATWSNDAVKSSAKKLQPILDECNEAVVLANINSPRQTVLSGPTEALERVESLLQTKGILFQRLGVATAFHSSVVAGSVAPFKNFLETIDFGAPQFPVFANSTAQPYPSEPAEQRRILAEQIASPVRFVEVEHHV